MQNDNKDFKDYIKNLPLELRRAIFSIDYPQKLQEIVKNNKLMIDQAGKLEAETTLVIVGIEPMDKYVNNLISHAGLSNIQASIVAHDVNESIFKNIRDSLKKINDQIKAIENQVATQGNTLDAALAEAGMSMDDLKKQIIFQKEIEKLLADKINVTDEEVRQYIEDNKIPIPQGQEATIADQIKNEIRNQKLNTEVQALIANLKSKAKIQRFVNY